MTGAKSREASGARHLFDGMAGTCRGRKVPRPGGEDRISELPDAVLQHVLGFLPADEAVRTCVLAQRWRHLWTYLGRLRFVFSDGRWKSVGDFDEFVNCVLLRREPSLALDVVEFSGDRSLYSTPLDTWIRHALLCEASVLSASLPTGSLAQLQGFDDVLIPLNGVTLDGPTLRSQHLTKLELATLFFDSDFLDFSGCPALEDLTITKSNISTGKIVSQSVKRLTIRQCNIDGATRIHISAPNTVWLYLHCYGSRAPFLESLPSLETAFVKLSYFVTENCTKGHGGECCGTCTRCLRNDDYSGRSLLLQSLSSAKNLQLIARRGTPTFYRDSWCHCPAFSKLKTLLLNEWCVAIDLHALVYILEHSPVLEKLTLQLAKGPGTLTELEGIYDPIEQLPAISDHLTVVEIKCGEVDGRVCTIFQTRLFAQYYHVYGTYTQILRNWNRLLAYFDMLLD